MKVLRLTPHYYWPQLSKDGWPVKFDAIGGMQSQIFRLSEELSRQGIDQEVVTLKIPGTPAIWNQNEKLKVVGVRIPIFPVTSKVRGMIDLNLSWALGALKRLAFDRNDFDLIHIHCSGVLWPPLLGVLTRRILRRPLIMTIHCSITATYHPMCWLDYLLLPIARKCEQLAIGSSSKVLCLTEKAREFHINHFGRGQGKYHVVSDGIDLDNFIARVNSDEVNRIKERFDFSRFKFVIGFVGRIAREKGWPWLVNLMQVLPNNIGMIVCGDGNEMLELKKALRKASLESRVMVTGYVPQAEVPNYLSTMNLLVLTSDHEEFGGVLLEAMACGVQVAGFDVGGVRAVLGEYCSDGLVPHGEIRLLAEAVLRLLKDQSATTKFRTFALERVRTNFDIVTLAKKTVDLYRDALPEQRGGNLTGDPESIRLNC